MTSSLDVVEMSTFAVVHSVDVRGRSDREVEKILSGLLRKIDTERFFVRETKEAKK